MHMKPINLKRMWIRRARDFHGLKQTDREHVDKLLTSFDSSVASVDLNLTEHPKTFWRGILCEAGLPPATRTAVALFVYGMNAEQLDLNHIYDVDVDEPLEFGNTLQMSGMRSPNAEMLLNNRWYPVIITVQFIEDSDKLTKAIQLRCVFNLGERTFTENHVVHRGFFLDSSGAPRTRTVIDILEELGYRRLQLSAVENNLRLVKAERMSTEVGKVVNITGSVIAPSKYSWWRGFETHQLGSPEMPSKGVVESALELGDTEQHYYFGYGGRADEESISRLPFVRIFSLETKAYVYADIDDLDTYEFDELALARLHLPNSMHQILARVFGTPIEDMFGDLLRGKHGGAVVLASGEPGVGKTLTAEIYAETTCRPLYVLELGELGTNAADVEENLQKVFARVTRWRAVLQFDECEIFLSKRGTELERSAIVGIFLRLLDYYRGLLFLTTNRPESLDEAVISRVMLRLKYPKLDSSTRAKIWQSMFEVAKLSLVDIDFETLAKLELNGREIRNLTRLAKIVHPDAVINRHGLLEVLQFGTDIEVAVLQKILNLPKHAGVSQTELAKN